MGLIDTHCHLDMLKGTPDEALAEARAAGVDAVVTVGIDLPSSRIAAALAARNDHVYATAGVHPHDAVTFGKVARTGLERLLGQPRVDCPGHHLPGPMPKPLDMIAGVMRQALAQALHHARHRSAFGRPLVPRGTFQ